MIILQDVLSFLFGTIDNFLITFTAVLFVEYITSTVNLIINKAVDFKKLFYPFIKYFYYFILIILSNFLDSAFSNGEADIRNGLIFFYISIELMVILNNSSIIGVPIPSKLSKIAKVLNDENKKE